MTVAEKTMRGPIHIEIDIDGSHSVEDIASTLAALSVAVEANLTKDFSVSCDWGNN